MKKLVGIGSVVAAAAMLLAACGGSSESADTAAPTAAASAPAAGGELSGTLTFVSWGGQYQEAQTVSMIDPFMAANPGVTIAQDSPTDNAKISQMVQAGNVTWDVVDNDPFFPIATCGTESEKLDFTVIDTSNMDPALVGECHVANMTYAYVLAYNTEKYGANPPKNWADFFDTAKFPGKRALGSSAQMGGYEVALLADGVAPDQLYPLDYDRAFAKLDSLGDDLIWWETGAQSVEMMEKGEIDMLLAWNGRGYSAAANGAPFAPAWDQNIIVYDVFMIPMGSPNKDLAMQFINYAIGAEAQGKLQSTITYASINSKSPAATGDETFMAWMPTEHTSVGIIQDQQWWAQNMDEATAKWTAWISG